jgi:uncharacterized protein
MAGGALIAGALTVSTVGTYAQSTANQDGPSFNCRYAKTPDEVLICQNSDLADRDVQLANFFYQLRNQMSYRMRGMMDADEAAWLRRRQGCGRDPVCISKAYDDRMNELGRRFCGDSRYDCTM